MLILDAAIGRSITEKFATAAAAGSGLRQAAVPPSSSRGRGSATVFVLYGIILGAGSSVACADPQGEKAQQPLEAQIEQALSVVHATMVELPHGPEAAAVARLTERLHRVRKENQYLTDTLRQLQKEHAALIYSSQSEIARLQSIAERSRDELDSLKSQWQALEDHLAPLPEYRHTNAPDLISRSSNDSWADSGTQNGAAQGESLVPIALGGDPRPKSEAYAPHIDTSSFETGTTSPAVVTARRIADELRRAQREAVHDGIETRFVLDVEQRHFSAGRTQEVVQIDPSISVSFLTAKSEAIDEHTGQIRFFPDGTSSGGQIRLIYERDQAEVAIRWWDGRVLLSPPE